MEFRSPLHILFITFWKTFYSGNKEYRMLHAMQYSGDSGISQHNFNGRCPPHLVIDLGKKALDLEKGASTLYK